MAFQIGALVGAFVLAYSSVLRDLATIWWTRDDYSHGFLILPISLYLVWTKRSELRQLSVRPNALWGPTLLAAAGVLLVFGLAARVLALSALSFVGMIFGLVLLFLGAAYARALAFPIGYLLFMVPVFDELFAPVHWPLQLLTARMSVGLLQALGVPAFLQQQYIALPRVTLEVATACAGTNYLLSTIAIGLPLAYLTLRTWWTRVALILGAVALGVVANWVRVALIAIWANLGREVLHGPIEIFRAMFVAWVSVLGLIVGAWGLAKLQKPRPRADDITRLMPRRDPDAPLKLRRAWSTALAVLLVLTASSTLLDRGPVDLKEDLSTFPLSIDGWHGRRGDVRDAVFRIEGADQELFRVYQTPESRPIQLYVAYLASQSHGKKLADYRTAALHRDAATQPITLQRGRVVTVNRGRLRGAGAGQHVIFWYDVNGRIIADRYRARLESMRDSLVHGSSNGALVLVAGGPGDESEMERLTRDLVPRLQASLR